MAADRSFLGRGWRFPVAVNLTGGLSSSTLDDSVRESMFIILGTAPGERLNRPTFGCRIHDLMFAPNNPLTAARAVHFVEEALYKFEPRLDDVTVLAETNPDEPNRLDIRIDYVIVGKNVTKNLVFPFYLRDEDEEAAKAK